MVSDPHPSAPSVDDEKAVDLSSLVFEPASPDEAAPNSDLPVKPVIVEIDDEKTLKLDLDEELAHSSIGDFDDEDMPSPDADDVDEGNEEADEDVVSKPDTDKVDEDRPPFA
jgi:hypothetical protein